MQVLSAEHYARLQRLARLYQQRHAKEIKRHPRRNPHLTVDMLCFQPLPDGRPEKGELVGALLTPVSLSLAVVTAQPRPIPFPEHEGSEWLVGLANGRYPFILETLGESEWLWHCSLLDDVSDIDTLQEANRLAQQLIERVMSEPGPSPTQSSTGR
ncbi:MULTISPECIES: [NiFe]-hydrogenase assembly chaperone HybE [Halomonadaceae]|uniref:[NiFe]-hydrogenase assembly chaperone HybE n=1 Tax=Halomonadaceae TaxID=28256 RepID=UPI001597E1A0|nr:MULTISPECIES: [NiFe]-hydrogenase assembly chaperone HybE [Halomonas]QJQ96691.1 [NiFe]-hydrogenase assembly chaperone HybE [Halomonas sp. PA5]